METNISFKCLEDEKFRKPNNSKSVYRYLRLENGLDTFLISNENLLNTNVNLVVKTGSAFEGKEIDGLAHFLEHALFLGTEKYPGANEFGKYVRTRGGSTNAATDSTMTHFSVNIPNAFIEQTLDMFCEFFKNPLFREDLLFNEIKIINNEFLSKTNNYYTLLEHIFKDISDRTHIYNKFYYGNHQTLHKRPIESGIDVREEMIKFYKNYYVSNNMILVLLSNLDINSLSELSKRHFSSIKSGKLEVETNPKKLSINPEYPFSGVKNKFIKVNMNSDNKELMLVFPIPSGYSFGEIRAFSRYISFFLSSDSPSKITNEIISQKGYCRSISVTDFHSNLGFSQIVISTQLTENGAKKIDKVIKTLYFYINAIKNTIFIDEFCVKINRDFKSKFNDLEKNINLIQIFEIVKIYVHSKSDPENFLYSGYDVSEFTSDVFKNLIDFLNLDKMFVMAIGCSFDIKYLNKEGIIKVSDHHFYSKKCQRKASKLGIILNKNKLESKFRIKERYFQTKYSIWDICENVLEPIRSMNEIQHGINFSSLNLPNQALSNMYSSDNLVNVELIVNLKPPLLFDIALEFENFKNKTNRTFEISSDLKITNIWKGFFYLFVSSNIIPESMFMLRSFLPPMYGERSSKIYQLKNLCIKNTSHSYALIHLLTELVKYKTRPILTNSEKYPEFQIYPTSNSYYPNYVIGIELFFYGRLNNISAFLLDFSTSLRSISSISNSEFIKVKNYAIESQYKLYRKKTQRDLLNDAEMRILNNGIVENSAYIELLREIKLKEIISLAEFLKENCLFEGIYVGSISPNILKSSLDSFIIGLRGKHKNNDFYSSKALLYVKDSPLNDNYSKYYYKQLFYKQNKESTPYCGSPTSKNYFDLIDLFSIPPDRNKLFFLENKYKCKHNTVRLSVFFKKEDPTTMVKLYIINQMFFDHLFELIRQKKQMAYELNSEINNVHDRLITYSFIIQTDSFNIIQTTNTLIECVSQLSPGIISEELFKVAIEERIEILSKKYDPNYTINEYIRLTNNKSFNYNWTNDLIESLKSLSFYQFNKWFSDSIKYPPIVITAIVSDSSSIKEKKEIEKYVPNKFIKLKDASNLFKFDNLRTFKLYHQVFN
ncbi:insulinase like peptidase [Cryptosporidium bovis]|uniref:insulinase like peptidase n=1 Tax=Cryptosporidium bovis TaxID=310047 RepID=UPI00351A39D2|nr:insulinase like peptidase [Cryptosporidium bovis]